MKRIDTSNNQQLPDTKIQFRILHHDMIAMGPGKAALLEMIDSTGSISAAGRSMNMSYRRAWMLVDVMNRCFKEPLVHTAKGGQHGGGASLTPFGRQILKYYRQVDLALQQTVQAYLPLFSGQMNPQPPEEADGEDKIENSDSQQPGVRAL